MIKFKYDILKDEFTLADPRTRSVVEDFEWLSGEFNKDPMITSIFRDDSAVHKAGRAIDLRDEHAGTYLYTEDERLALVHYINALYPRSDNKKTCIHHDAGTGHHFHIQVPPNA